MTYPEIYMTARARQDLWSLQTVLRPFYLQIVLFINNSVPGVLDNKLTFRSVKRNASGAAYNQLTQRPLSLLYLDRKKKKIYGEMKTLVMKLIWLVQFAVSIWLNLKA